MSDRSTGTQERIHCAAWRQMLTDKASAMGIRLTSLQVEQFTIYAAELIKWSRRINLTAISAPEEIVAKHFMDSLAAADQFDSDARVLDIGTGAGFPGLPLKLYRPSLSMTLIDGSRKRINFVTHLVRTLALKDISPVQIRSEQLRSDAGHRQAYDAVVSRAVCSLKELVEGAIEFVKPDGRILAWKGARADEEIEELTVSATDIEGDNGRRLEIHQKAYELPGFGEKRVLVIVHSRS